MIDHDSSVLFLGCFSTDEDNLGTSQLLVYAFSGLAYTRETRLYDISN